MILWSPQMLDFQFGSTKFPKSRLFQKWFFVMTKLAKNGHLSIPKKSIFSARVEDPRTIFGSKSQEQLLRCKSRKSSESRG